MFTRVQKQIVIGALYVVFLLGVSAFAASLLPLVFQRQQSATCLDGVKNQNEEDIDCGGVCRPCNEVLQQFLQKIVVQWAKAFPVGGGRYDLAAYVQNPNFTYGGEEVVYSFTARDANGDAIKSVEGKTYILPNERRYLIAQGVQIAAVPANVEVEIRSVLWQKFTNFSQSGLRVEDKKIDISPPGSSSVAARGSGIVVNDSPYNLRSIEVQMAAFDASGNPIAVNRSDVQTVLSGERRFVEVVWPAPIIGDVRSFLVEARTNFFENENFIAEHGTPQKFQEYYRY